MTGEDARPPLSIHKFREHFTGIDGDEQAFTVSQHFALLVENFSGVGVMAAADPDFPRLDTQRLIQRYRLQIVDGDG